MIRPHKNSIECVYQIQISYHKKSIRIFTESIERVYQSFFFLRSFTTPAKYEICYHKKFNPPRVVAKPRSVVCLYGTKNKISYDNEFHPSPYHFLYEVY